MSNQYEPPLTPPEPPPRSAQPSATGTSGRRRRPAGLTAICVIAIVLGVMGAMGSLTGLVMQAMGPAMQTAFLPSGGAPGMEELQEEMMQRMLDITSGWMPFNIVLYTLTAIVSVCMVIGAIRSLRFPPRGRGLLLAALAGGAVLALAGDVPNMIMQRQVMDVTGSYMGEMGRASVPPGQAPPPGMDSMMSGIMTAVGAVTMVALGGWLVLKLVFYLWGVLYLRRADVRELYAAEVPA